MKERTTPPVNTTRVPRQNGHGNGSDGIKLSHAWHLNDRMASPEGSDADARKVGSPSTRRDDREHSIPAAASCISALSIMIHRHRRFRLYSDITAWHNQ